MGNVDGVDYVYQNYCFTFQENDEKKDLIINPIDDNLVESDETYTLTIEINSTLNRVKLGENSTTTITIYNDDGNYI